MRINLPILFSQNDSRWANKLLGFNKDTRYNIDNYGCLISCIAMICRYYGKNDNPETINDKLCNLGTGLGFIDGTGNYIYGSVKKIYSDISEEFVRTPNLLTNNEVDKIKSSLDNGNPVIIQIDYSPKTVEFNTHFVVVVDYNTNDENDLTIIDPIGGKKKSLKEYLGWYRLSMRKSIETVIFYSGPKPDQNSAGMMLIPKDIFPDLVHGSTEWDKTVAKYLPDESPKQKNFEDVQKVLSAHFGRVTEAERMREEVSRELIVAKTEIMNLNDKLANTQSKCQRDLALKETELSAIYSGAKSIDAVKQEYQSTISFLELQLRHEQKRKGELEIELAQCKSSNEVVQNASQLINSGFFLYNYIKPIFQYFLKFLGK